MKRTQKQIFVNKLKEKYLSVLIGMVVVGTGFSIFGQMTVSIAGGADFHNNGFISTFVKRDNNIDRQSSSSGQIDSEAAATSQVKISSDIYVVQPGDTLSIISQKIYGDMYLWDKIAVANNIMNVDNIEEGTVLNIPRN